MPINYLKKIQLNEFNKDGYRISPVEGMESVIEGFYIFSRDQKLNTDLIFNDGYPVLVFLESLEDSVLAKTEKTEFEIKGVWANAGSIKNLYVTYNNNTTQLFIIRFHPDAFYRLFNLDSQYFRYHPIVPFEKIAQDHHFSIAEFFSCNSIEEKVAFFGTYVQDAGLKIGKTDFLDKTLEYIHKTKGRSTVRNVAKDTGLNYKWIERNFVKRIGLLPKEYIQLHRFIHAYHELLGSNDVDLMRIAVSNGYYDSNHFLKEFKSYTGKTPIKYLKFQSQEALN